MAFEQRILHLQLPQDTGSVATYLQSIVAGTPGLVELGAIYLDGKRLIEDRPAAAGQYLRVHVKPKRFSQFIPATPIEIFEENEDWIVALKPFGLPTHATLDNKIENLKALVERQRSEPLFIVHRLDQWSAGKVLFAKNSISQKILNNKFAKRRIKKEYIALTSKPLPIGRLVHFIDPTGKPPRRMQTEPAENFWKCEMEILNSVEYAAGLFKNDVRLLSGHTHQIRAQCAAIGVPLVGDTLYGSPDSTPKHWPNPLSELEPAYRSALFCSKLEIV